MNAAIITVGDEILRGYTLDSNSTWMGRRLMDISVSTVWKVTVGDSKPAIQEALGTAAEKAHVIICTGGLGPTSDDVTKEAFCEFIGAELKFDRAYYRRLEKAFRKRGYAMPESNRSQAYIPDKGEIIPNPKGSALGIRYVDGERRYYVLPGVPAEMKAMVETTVLPELENRVTDRLSVTIIRTTGIMESALYDSLSDLTGDAGVTVAFLPGFMGVDIRLTSRVSENVMDLASAIYDRVGKYIYAEDWETLEEAVGRLLRERGLSIAVAESCTGGLLGDRLTDVPGSSAYFLGGVVSYSNEAKSSILGVRSETLASFGAVSEQTATEMARGVRMLFQADLGLSITGIAGPSGGTSEKPVGLTCIGLDFSGDCQVRRLMFSQDRRFNKELAAQSALNLVRLAIDQV